MKDFGTVIISFIENPFEPLNSIKPSTDLHGRALHTYLKGFCLGQKFLVRINGKFIEDFDYIVQPNDNIWYAPLVQGGGGGKNIFRLVTTLALSIVAPFAGGYLATGTWAAASGFAATAYTAGVFIAGNMLINAVLPPTTSSFSASTPETESPSYSWQGVTTNNDLNVPIPVLYGTFKLGGTSINTSYTYDEDDDWLAIQLALCHGEIQEIRPEHIQAGGASFSSLYVNEVDGYFKYADGSFDQPILTGFDDTSYNNGTVVRELEYNVPYTFLTDSNSIDNFKLHFEAPKGLFTSDNQGNLSDKEVQYKVEYRKVGDAEWKNVYQRQTTYVTEYQYTDNPPAIPDGSGNDDPDYGFGDDDTSGYTGDSFGGDFGSWA